MILRMSEDGSAYFDGSTSSYKSLIKAIPGNGWDRKHRYWTIPIESLEDAKQMLPTLEVDQEVTQAYAEMKIRNGKAIAVKNGRATGIVNKVKGIKGKLYPYQAQGRAFIDATEDNEGKLLAFDMGLGKSLTALAAFVDWKRRGIVDYCLVVCPSPLKYSTWEKEVLKWTDLECVIVDGDHRQEVQWDDGTTSKLHGQELRAVQYAQWQYGVPIIVVNYELFLRDMDIMPTVNERWLIVLDECQRAKNPKSQTYKNLVKLAKKTGRRILASGTPLENNIQELWTLIDLCKPGLLGAYGKFEDRYCEKDYWGSVVGPKTALMPELKQRIAPIMMRKTKKEALPDLPELTVEDYWVTMTKTQEKLYKTVKAGIIENLSTGEFSYLETLAQLTRLQQLVDSPALLREVLGDESLPVDSGKLKELKHIIKDLDPYKNKFVLFSQYKQMTDILLSWLVSEKLLRKEQIGYIRGGLSPRETARIQQGFQEGDIQCVLMTTAGNYGIELSSGTYVICYDQLFNPQKMSQIYSRAHRNGAKQAVTAINLMTKNSYEERKLKILEGKRELFKTMIEDDDLACAGVLSKDELVSMM